MLKASKFVVRHRRSRLTFAAFSIVVLAATGSAFSQTANHQDNGTPYMRYDLPHRSPDIHWPAGFDPLKADLFAHNALFINATCERVWQHIIEAPKWPQWYPNSKDVHINSDAGSVLKNGSTFRWTTFGISIESKINEFVPFSRMGWYGYAPGAKPTFYHTWYLTPRGSGCDVVTEEVGNGPDAANFRKSDEGLLHRGHDLWLATLRWVAENKLN